MPVCAPTRELHSTETCVMNERSEAELKRKLMRVVDDGHRQVLQGNTVDAKKVTSDIRRKLGIAS